MYKCRELARAFARALYVVGLGEVPFQEERLKWHKEARRARASVNGCVRFDVMGVAQKKNDMEHTKPEVSLRTATARPHVGSTSVIQSTGISRHT